jgi:predicted Zn finger-like uncharacterized protein
MFINCPSCQKGFEIIDEELEIRRRLTCPNCSKYFEVTWLYPFTIDLIEDSLHNPNNTPENKVQRFNSRS